MSLARIRMAVALHESEMTEEQAEREFFDTVKIFHHPSSSEFKFIAHTYSIVKVVYKDERRQEVDSNGERKLYISHLRTVAFAMMFLGYHDYVTVLVALLHDIREDFPDEWPYERIVQEFGPEVAKEVESITRPYDDGRLRRATVRVKRIKIVDRAQNMKTYYLYSPEKRQRKIRETIEELLPLAVEISFDDELKFFLKQWHGIELT